MATRVFVEPSGRRVAPFDDAPGDVLIANRPLADWQDAAFREAGLVRADTPAPPCLIVPDTLFTTGAVLRRFVREAAGRNAVLGLASSRFGERTAHVQPGVVAEDGGWRFDAVRFRSGGDEPAVTVWVDPDETTLSLPLPAAFRDGDGPAEVSLPRHPILTVHHWVHILWANQAAGSVEVRSVPRWRSALRVLWAVIRARSLNRWEVLRRLSTVGRGCDIHPTARVEGSTLGAGVTVGPYARVLFSRVGDGATILAGAQVEACTIGDGATVAQQAVMRLCVVYPEAFAGQHTMQASVVGRGALTTLASYCIDLHFEHEVRVPLDGALHAVGTRFLGSAIGHRARLGTGVWVAAGRSVPNDTWIVRDPSGVVARVPTDADGRWYARDGGVAPVGGKD